MPSTNKRVDTKSQTMTTNREIIDARIQTHLKHTFAPDYRVYGVRTRWVGQWHGENYYTVRYFLVSHRFIGGIRYDKVGVCDKEVRLIYDDQS